ncbi:imidazolonepropionase [Arsenicicoccus sp. oral taxon 190]|uniref:imidazolonepropionase n=1 Tax=Arsenicicoccus sp. oral taxon 190 TaxID=1658671 RepID=UPI00067A1D24|nr:imidazolonepropionase [Arsenicicoccus sp. oral taxon 190]AKT51111.1 imidazolonepropionase [Arsenicicoccus sp. oral taxon 190]
MTSVLVTDIGELVTCDPTLGDESALGILHDAAIVVTDLPEPGVSAYRMIEGEAVPQRGSVAWVGPAAQAPAADHVLSVEGRCVVPGFVDSHAHLMFAGDRGAEFAARMTGQPYDGGGIAVSVAATRAASDDELLDLLIYRLAEMRAQGTTTVEVKSGYGLTVEDEVRALRLAVEAGVEETTFLGAHVVPAVYRDRRSDYVDLVTGPMLQACAPYAVWGDVFCEPASAHAFDGDEARVVLEACRDAGLELRVHGNQLSAGPGVQLACELGAASVDHCTYLTPADVDALVDSAATTTATLLPGVEFSTRSPYPDARALLDAGVSVALATDCNPGTCYSSSIPFVVALAVREMGMTPGEALLAVTRGGAQALRRYDVGHLGVGARPDLAVLDAPSYVHLSYRAGVPIATALDLTPPA